MQALWQDGADTLHAVWGCGWGSRIVRFCMYTNNLVIIGVVIIGVVIIGVEDNGSNFDGGYVQPVDGVPCTYAKCCRVIHGNPLFLTR